MIYTCVVRFVYISFPHLLIIPSCVIRFEPYVLPAPEIRDFTCHEVTAVFSVSAFQYITMAITFSKGVPYRKSMLTNCKTIYSTLHYTSSRDKFYIDFVTCRCMCIRMSVYTYI